jgi:hypothetical protein
MPAFMTYGDHTIKQERICFILCCGVMCRYLIGLTVTGCCKESEGLGDRFGTFPIFRRGIDSMLHGKPASGLWALTTTVSFYTIILCQVFHENRLAHLG